MTQIRILSAGFWVMLAGYCAILLIDPQLGPADEYHFLPTLQQGRWFPMYGPDFPYYDSDALGRFLPLAGQEYNLAAIFSRTAFSYYLLNAVELSMAMALLVGIIRRTSGNTVWAYVAGIYVLLVPAVSVAFFKLLYVDRGVFLFTGCLIYAFIRFAETQKARYWVAALLAANIAIYYKEAAFSIVLAFSVSHLVLTRRSASRAQRLLDAALALSAVLYLAIYLVRIIPVSKAAFNPYGDQTIIFVKNLFNYALVSDPLAILGFVPLFVFRLWRVVVGKHAPHPILDPMLAAAVGYVCVFFVLNIYMPYYMLPAYMLGVPAFVHFVLVQQQRVLGWRIAVLAIGLASVLNSIPLGLHFLTYNKYVPSNFHKTMIFLVEDIGRRYEGKRIPIFFEGVDRGAGRGVYYVVGEYLRYHGLSIRKFDLKSGQEAREPGPFLGHASPLEKPEDLAEVLKTGALEYPQYPFSVFQPGPLSEPRAGDYLVLSPHSTKQRGQAFLKGLEAEYDLVFAAEGALAIPRVGLKTLVKQAMLTLLPAERREELIVSENLMNWPNYYVFVKR